MRVAHVVPAITFGGMWRHLEAVERLRSHNIESLVISLFDVNDDLAVSALRSPVQQMAVPLTAFRDKARIGQRLQRLIDGFRADIVHSYHVYSDIYAFHDAAYSATAGVRSVLGITQATWEEPFARHQLRRDWGPSDLAMELDLESRVMQTLAVSHELRQRLVRYGLRPDKLRVCYFGVDPIPDVDSTRFLRPIKSTEVVIGFLHRLEPVKNPLLLFDILANLNARGLRPRFLMIRGGSFDLGFRSEAERRGVSSCFEWLAASANLWDSVPPMHALLLTSRTEGLPLIVLEAMARGIPVVATQVGGLSELIINGESGRLATDDDAADVATALCETLSSPGEQLRLAAAGRERVRSKFTLSRHVAELAHTYQQVTH